MSKQPQYFSPSVGAKSKQIEIDLTLPDLSLRLTTDTGVFSPQRVDTGTKYLLLEGPPPDPEASLIADIGAGYGPIALALARRHPQATVWAVEVNERARSLCQRNAGANGIPNLVVADPEQVPSDLVFDRIWSNPPIRIGKPALHDLLGLWLDRLAPAGSAHLVVQKHLGSDSLARWLTEQGWATQRRSSRKAYRILDVTPRS